MAGRFVRVNGIKVQAVHDRKEIGTLWAIGTFRIKDKTYVVCECLCGGHFVTTESNAKQGITKSCGCHKKVYTVDDDWCSQIDTELKAWAMGFILADGCVTDRLLAVTVSRCDSDALEKILLACGSNVPIKETHGSGYSAESQFSRIGICSVALAKNLSRAGIAQRKSLTAIPPKVTEDMEKHFWRGVVDGDGWLLTNTGPKKRRLWNWSMRKSCNCSSLFCVGKQDVRI